MFKIAGTRLTGGRRSSRGSGSRPGRVSATRMGHVAPLDTQAPRKPAFQPYYEQEHGFDSNSGRLSGLEKS